MSEPNEPRVEVEGEEIVGCLAADQSDGEQPASERAALEEENRLAEEYAETEQVSAEETNADVYDMELIEADVRGEVS